MKNSVHVASAPAKVILFGEHFVVYGKPALLAAIDRRTTVKARIQSEKKVSIKSDIGAYIEYSDSGFEVLRGNRQAKSILDPINDAVTRAMEAHSNDTGVSVLLKSKIPPGVGLGSSAASCVASIAAVSSIFGRREKQWVCNKAIESERMIHKNSSGADCYVSTFGGIMRYGKEDGFKTIEAKEPLRLVVSSTGVRHSTGALVEGVRKFRDANPAKFKNLSEQSEEISHTALKAIGTGNIEKLGQLMVRNQQLLEEIGVSHSKSNTLVNLSLKAGAIGAKITGAGGGGAVIALAASNIEGARITADIRKAGYDSMLVQIDHKGLIF
jgi:mevalonate kinase